MKKTPMMVTIHAMSFTIIPINGIGKHICFARGVIILQHSQNMQSDNNPPEKKVLKDLYFFKDYQSCQNYYQNLDDEVAERTAYFQASLVDNQVEKNPDLTIDQIIGFIAESTFRFHVLGPYVDFAQGVLPIRKFAETMKNTKSESLGLALKRFAYLGYRKRFDNFDQLEILLSNDKETLNLSELYGQKQEKQAPNEALELQIADRDLSVQLHSLFHQMFSDTKAMSKNQALINLLVQSVSVIRSKHEYYNDASNISLKFHINLPFTQKMKDIIQSDTMKKFWTNSLLYHKAMLVQLLNNEDSAVDLKSSPSYAKQYPFYFKDGQSTMHLFNMITLTEVQLDQKKDEQVVYRFETIFDELERLSIFLDQFKN